jgi:IS605 OrfB family transposase
MGKLQEKEIDSSTLKLSTGDILFKLESTDVKIPIKISNKKHSKELINLQDLCLTKGISLTVKLTHDKIYLTFDETILNETNFDYKMFQKDKPSGLNKEQTKEYWKSKYKEHEEKLKSGKLERYLSIDVNPNEIGFSISDDKLNILDKGGYRITGKVNENKRKHEYSQIIKDLFKKVKHFKIRYFVIEDLELNKDNYGNKVSNRKNKLEFKKNYIFSLIERRCNETGTILRKVNPCYSSFIGNLMYKEYDPIASSIEILRRGIGQYNKGFKLIPELDKDKIITDLIDDSLDLNQFNGFTDLFKSIRNKSYRRKEISFSSQKFTKSDKSHVCICF